jgi:hypothetical protein
MKTRKHIMITVVLMVLFGTVSSSLAKPRKHGYRGKSYVRNSYRRKVYQRPHSYRRKVYQRPHGRSSIAISLPRLRVVIGAPRTRVIVALPPKVIEPAEITVWITNDNGSLTAVTLTRRFSGYIGPLGEYYPTMPTEEQLKILYGVKPKNISHLCPQADY